MKSLGYLLTSLSVAGVLSVAVAAHSAEKSSAAATEKAAAATDKPDCDDAKAEHHYGKRGHNVREGGHEGGRANFGKILGLTDAQQKTLASAREKEQASAGELREKMMAAQQAIFKAADSNASDEELNKLAANSASLHAQLELGRIKMHRQLVAILTPEQKQKLTEWESQHRPEHREHI